MKLLIAVDSAISTEVLLDAVGVRPWPEGTTAHVLSVVVDAEVPLEVWREFGYGKDAVRREMERRGKQITALAVERLKAFGIQAEVLVSRGDPRHLIPFFARKWYSDLIFVRAHVRKDFEHWMVGSVARAVVTAAPCTVQIVRDGGEDHKQTLQTPRRVLLAAGRSDTALIAAEALAGRPWPDGSEFRIVTVVEPWLIRPKSAVPSTNSAEQILASAGLKATTAVLSGNPKDVILEEAKKWNADLLVVGSHERRGFRRFLLGSVSEAVAMNAHCSVVVVRDSSRASRTTRTSD